MTGPEHYREAEGFLAILDAERDPKAWTESVRDGSLALSIAAAQVHATLALAAATAIGHIAAALGGMDEDAWIQAVSLYSRGERP